jgi:drug/metabolite transporter (DMT)-like permease
MYGHLVVMAVVNIVLPFLLITWAVQYVDSALASILNATVPLFVIVIAALTLHDEPITVNRLAGLGIGFAGVVVLTARGMGGGGGDVLAEIALVASAVSYAIGGVYSRRFVRGLRPMIPAVFQVGFAFVICAVLALVLEQPIGRIQPSTEAILSIVWLGILGSGFAYLAFFRLIRNWGATRTSSVAYLLPVVGIALGAVAGEEITLVMIGGTLLVIAGVALVNSRYGTRRLFGRSTPATPAGEPGRAS